MHSKQQQLSGLVINYWDSQETGPSTHNCILIHFKGLNTEGPIHWRAYFLSPMIITAIAVFTGSIILILLVLLVFLLLKKTNVFGLCLSIGWWTEVGRFWSCESIRHSCQMLLCWGEQTLTCSPNFFIFSSIHVITGLGREGLLTMPYTKEALHKSGIYINLVQAFQL